MLEDMIYNARHMSIIIWIVNNMSFGIQKCCFHIDGLVQERRNSIANALELHVSYTNPSIFKPDLYNL